MASSGDEDSCLLLPEWSLRSGPRRTVYHNPKEVRCVGNHHTGRCKRRGGSFEVWSMSPPLSRRLDATSAFETSVPFHMQHPSLTFHLKVLAAIVTCGGLCPGLNDVVQNIAYTLHDHGVPEENVLGIRCEDV